MVNVGTQYELMLLVYTEIVKQRNFVLPNHGIVGEKKQRDFRDQMDQKDERDQRDQRWRDVEMENDISKMRNFENSICQSDFTNMILQNITLIW